MGDKPRGWSGKVRRLKIEERGWKRDGGVRQGNEKWMERQAKI